MYCGWGDKDWGVGVESIVNKDVEEGPKGKTLKTPLNEKIIHRFEAYNC